MEGVGVQDARKELLKNLNKNREMEAKLSQDLKRFEDCDPEVLRAKGTCPGSLSCSTTSPAREHKATPASAVLLLP